MYSGNVVRWYIISIFPFILSSPSACNISFLNKSRSPINAIGGENSKNSSAPILSLKYLSQILEHYFNINYFN